MSNESKINITFWSKIILLLSVMVIGACGTTKYLQEDEAFLEQNIIKIKGDYPPKKVAKLEEELLKIPLQKPNANFFGINRRWFYYNKQKKGKLKEEEEAGTRHVYEVPSIYEEVLSQQTIQSMNNFLYQKGYYHSTITFETTIKKKHATVTYMVDPGPLYTVDTLRFNSPDTAIQRILTEISPTTVLQKGTPASIQLYEQEKRRIINELRNRGYRYFYINYIDQLSTETDTSKTTELDLSLTVFPIIDGSPHQVYQVGQVTVYPYYLPNQKILVDTLIEGILFRYTSPAPFPIKPATILKRIALKKDSLYRQEDFNKTIRNLGAIGIFKFADVRDQTREDSSNIIDFNIYLPANKKIVLGADIEIRNTFSNTNAPTNARGQFLGGALDMSYRNRNLFRGSDDFRFNFQIGGEFGTNGEGGPTLFRSFDVNPRAELNIPTFSDPLHLARLFNNIGFFSNNFYNSLLENATTRISLGVNWSSRRDFWGFFSGDLTLGYSMSNLNRQYYLDQIGISFFNPEIGPDAIPIFENNPFLARSFDTNQLFTGLLFRNFGVIFTNRSKKNNDSWRLNFNMEVSGLEVAAINGVVNLFRDNNITFRLFDLEYSKFARLEFDGSYYKYINSTQSLAFRLNTGIAFHYAQSNEVPYVKQFFAGGPTSVRAWKIRELGPGGYRDPATFPAYSANPTPFYQTGDFKFIFSIEHRFKLFKLYSLNLEGATFIDGGNVWILNEDESRPDAKLTTQNFLRQIALGAGFGVRLDFEYFKLALDMGYRVRNPYPNPEGSYWAYQRWREIGLRGINYNLSVGYPF